jgi:hypothetical protein
VQLEASDISRVGLLNVATRVLRFASSSRGRLGMSRAVDSQRDPRANGYILRYKILTEFSVGEAEPQMAPPAQ